MLMYLPSCQLAVRQKIDKISTELRKYTFWVLCIRLNAVPQRDRSHVPETRKIITIYICSLRFEFKSGQLSASVDSLMYSANLSESSSIKHAAYEKLQVIHIGA